MSYKDLSFKNQTMQPACGNHHSALRQCRLKTLFRRHCLDSASGGDRFQQQGFAALHDFFQQVDVRMLAGMGVRVGNMFGKPYQTLLCRFFIQFSAKALYSLSEPSLP